MSPKKKPSAIGSYARNLHEGRRSEYLALYFFSALGTAVPVPTQEDTGLDLHCTIADVVGRRAWPRCFYSVQVKSEMKSWSIEGTDSVQWLADQPFPIFLCIVDKAKGRFRLYQTLPRHLLRACPPLPDRVQLEPGKGANGTPTQSKSGTQFLSLGAPILDFGLEKFLDESFISLAKAVISGWVLWDNENIHMRNSGIRRAVRPTGYTTNEPIRESGQASTGRLAQGEGLVPAMVNLSRSLVWTALCLARSGQPSLAVRMALLLRRLGTDCPIELLFLLSDLCAHRGHPAPRHIDSFFAGLDEIDAAIEAMLPEEWRSGPLVPASKQRPRASKCSAGKSGGTD